MAYVEYKGGNMIKKDVIIKVLKKHEERICSVTSGHRGFSNYDDVYVIEQEDYETVATELIKLFKEEHDRICFDECTVEEDAIRNV